MNGIDHKAVFTDQALGTCASYVDVPRWQLQSFKADPVGRIGHAASTGLIRSKKNDFDLLERHCSSVY
jgi:hypothetical protein